ncbi:uncharacterized protein LOC134258562 [Saccostrea cucullata]|uniref:uncharacterized protein LOC134258562 n=1 Tax=Saccostrea cuccullata TaxID=36930 RepID=UPI002ED47D74
MDSLTTVTVKGRADGRVLKLKVSKSILSSLQSPNVSKDIKQLIINGLIQDQINEDGKKSPSSTETQVTTGTVGRLITKNNTPSNSETATVREPPVNTPPVNTPPVNTTDDSFKVWKETEEKFLIDTRHQMEDAFKKKRNHGDLWKEIAEKLLDLNCKVTPNQCLYKYNALKKMERSYRCSLWLRSQTFPTQGRI